MNLLINIRHRIISGFVFVIAAGIIYTIIIKIGIFNSIDKEKYGPYLLIPFLLAFIFGFILPKFGMNSASTVMQAGNTGINPFLAPTINRKYKQNTSKNISIWWLLVAILFFIIFIILMTFAAKYGFLPPDNFGRNRF